MVMIVAGGLFLIATFLPWYRIRIGGLSASHTAWGSGGLGVLAALCGIAAGAVAAAVATRMMDVGAASAGLLEFVLSAAAAFFTFVRLVIRPPGTDAAIALTRGLLHVSRGLGILFALLLAIVMTIVGYRTYRENAV